MIPVNPEFLDAYLEEESVLLEPRDQFDRAIIGIAARPNLGPVACYDVELVLDVLMKTQNFTRGRAIEWFEYNIASAWFGEGTPVFLVRGEG